MTDSTKFKRPALLAGNKAGKLPHTARRLGKWLWPTTAIAIAAGTVWGVRHIEDQLETAAPKIIEKAGLDASQLEFDASYRDVKVTGTLPQNTSAKHLEVVLAKYRGGDGESIRNATVYATSPVIEKPNMVKPAIVKQDNVKPTVVKTNPVVIQDTREIQPEDVIVSAITDGEKLTLTGMVPTEEHAKVLSDAALHSFSASNIINTLTVTDQPATIATAEERINDFATVLSNLEDDVRDAQIDLDNNIISGNITTTDLNMSRKIKAVVPNSMINVITEHEVIPVATTSLSDDTISVVPLNELTEEDDIPMELVTTEAVTDYRPTDSIASLQDEFTLLAESIREFVVFAPSSDVLAPSATGILDDIVLALDAFPEVLIEIAGHTDSHSSATYNQDLSQRRAQSVANYLASQGVDESRLRPNGYGESQPIASNDTADGRAQNRRVEFWAF